MRLLPGLTFRLLFCLTVIAAAPAASLHAQDRERLITRAKSGMVPGMSLEPGGALVQADVVAIEIIEIKVAGVPVTLGQPFTAGEDWLKDLTVRVRNVSAKPMVWVSMGFGMPEAKLVRDGRESFMGFQVEYVRGGIPREGAPAMKAIMPGEEAELVCFAQAYPGFKKQVEKRTGVKSINTLRTGGDVKVVFEDNTMWFGSNLEVGGGASAAQAPKD